ncbi:MAG: hypothetical protein K0R57_2089 [Paenibacillaceae bacterium]|jgi:hypothetical protein|nr:hypothetical protein [Paenibacillaceae bacterium]
MASTELVSLGREYTTSLAQATSRTTALALAANKTRDALNGAFDRRRKLDLDTGKMQTAQMALMKLNQNILDLTNSNITIYFLMGNLSDANQKQKGFFASLRKSSSAPIKIMFKLWDAVKGPLKSLFGAVKDTLFNATKDLLQNLAKKTVEIIKTSLKSAASFEQSTISIEHIIGINNKGMSADKVKQQAAQYMSSYRSQPELSGFDTKEVQTAGTRALSVAQGNTKEATNLLRLAADMSAVTPGKSLSDALDALADLKKGEGDAMQDFGFYVKESSIKAAGKDLGKVQSIKGVAMKDAFKGGGARQGESAIGLWTNISNSMKNGMMDMGKDALAILKPALKSWADFFRSDGVQKMFTAGSKMMAGLASGVAERSLKIQNWLSTTFFNNVEFQNAPGLVGKFQFVLTELKKGFDGWYEAEGEAMFAGLISNGIAVLDMMAPLFVNVAAKIGMAIGEGLIDGLKQLIADHPLLSGLAGAAGGAYLGSAFGPMGALIGGVAGGLGGLGTSLGLKFFGGKDEKDKDKDTKPDPLKNAPVPFPSTNPPTFLTDSVWGKPASISQPKDPRHTSLFDAMNGVPKGSSVTGATYDRYPEMLQRSEQILSIQEKQNIITGSPVTINLTANKQVDPDTDKLMKALRSAVETAGFNMAPGGVPA